MKQYQNCTKTLTGIHSDMPTRTGAFASTANDTSLQNLISFDV